MVAGFHLGILNTAEAWVAKDLGLDLATQGAVITSAVIVGAVVGSLFAGQAADALGPKRALLMNNAWLLVGCVLCSGTPAGYWGLLAGQHPNPAPCKGEDIMPHIRHSVFWAECTSHTTMLLILKQCIARTGPSATVGSFC